LNGFSRSGVVMSVEGEGVLARATDCLAEALILWVPEQGNVLFANRVGRANFLTPGGDVIEPLRSAAADYRGTRDVDTSLPKRLDVRGCRWYVRTSAVTSAYESIVAHRPSSMSELELLERFRQRYRLADRKLDVLRNVLRGRSNLEIARALRIAYPTVRRHLVELLDALGVNNKFELFRIADTIRNDEPVSD
jgi:DNA-binding CsgD family transcriptional regulator